MIKLAALLIGAAAVRRRWWLLTVVGVAWTALGLAIVADASDGITVVTTQTFGYLLVIEGLADLLGTIWNPVVGTRLLLMLRALVVLSMGLLIIDMPWSNDIANSLLFGIAFLVDGAIRIFWAALMRHSRWRLVVLGGAIELVLAALSFFNWPIPYKKTVPFCIGLALVLSGMTAVRIGFLMRRLRAGASITELPGFDQRRWHVRLPPSAGPPAPSQQSSPLVVCVWTPVGSARDPRRRPLIDRYVAAVDKKGVISTGHAALEVAPNPYISHYPAREIDLAPREFAKTMRATVANDVPGRFLPSYSAEVAEWCEADARVAFQRYDVRRLRAFWDVYRANDTYNLTNRNCSIVVAVALDAALEGVLAETHGPFRWARLLASTDLWIATVIRSRAEAATWTPGLVLDYAQALQHVTEGRG